MKARGLARACCARWASVFYRRAPRSPLLLPISAAPSAGAAAPRWSASFRQRSVLLRAAHLRLVHSSVTTVCGVSLPCLEALRCFCLFTRRLWLMGTNEAEGEGEEGQSRPTLPRIALG